MRRPSPDCFIRAAAVFLFALVFSATLAATPVHATAFIEGDLYLVTTSMANNKGGIVRIQLPAGTVSTLIQFPGTEAMSSTAVYDAYRDKIIFSRSGVAGPLTIDAAGVEAALSPGFPTCSVVASRGDGLIYFWNHHVDGTDGFYFVDAAGISHDLLNEAGTAIYQLTSGRYVTEMIYEPVTNSLIGLTHSGLPSVCADVNQLCVARIPLTSDGRQVAGPIVSTQFDVSGTPETIVGASYATSGNLLITVDTNSGTSEPRMKLLNPVAMTTTTFASNNNFFAAATNAGVYSHVLGQAVVDNTGDNNLLAFSSGETSGGTRVATGVSGAGSNETARLLEIGRYGVSLGVSAHSPGAELELSAAPNPATAAITLSYTLGRAQSVRLAIHDIAGRTVRVIASSEWQSAGNHAVAWDGRDASGGRVRPGVYSAVLLTHDTRRVRHVIMLR